MSRLSRQAVIFHTPLSTRSLYNVDTPYGTHMGKKTVCTGKMAGTASRCLKFTLKSAYDDVEGDCCGNDPGTTRLCIDSEYCIRAATPANVSDFLTSVLTVVAPTMVKPVAEYFAAQFTALAGAGTFNDCKQFDEVDANGNLVADGYSLCICMSSVEARRRRACICRNTAPPPPKCCGSK